MQFNKIQDIHRATILRQRLELMAAIAADIGGDCTDSFSIDQIWTKSIGLPENIWNRVGAIVQHFERTYQKIPVEKRLADYLAEAAPNMLRYLHRQGFAMNNNGHNLEIGSMASKGSPSLYISAGGIGFSFGSLLYLFAYLQAYSLGATSCNLIIYTLPEEISVFPELLRIVNSEYSNISIKPIATHQFTLPELQQIQASGSTRGLHKHISECLYRMYDMESEMVAQNSRQPITSYPDYCFHYLQRLAAGCVTRRIISSRSYPKLETSLESFLDPQKPMVLLVNRDDKWVGAGQPHRDTDISRYEELVLRLLNNGMQVIRYNTVGRHLCINNKDFKDLAQSKASPFDQMLLAQKCSFVIGSNNGALAFGQFVSGCPTLVINAPDVTPHSPWTTVMHHPKNIAIRDVEKVSRIPFEIVMKTLFGPGHIWSDSLLTELGLASSDATPTEMADIAEDFTRGEYAWNLATTTLRDLGLQKYTGYNTVITRSGYQNLLALRTKLKAICKA